jgi:YD repeat-containing protein
LPDGKPIVVLCKQVEQATTDADGGSGFAAAVDATVEARVSRWTYNQFGQMLTAVDALNRTTTYTYYSDTAFTGTDPNAVGHTRGDLQTVINAAGHLTQYTQYDKLGNWLQMVDPNGVVTSRTFDLRQRLLTADVGGRLTRYEYWPAGMLKRLEQPDGSYVSYEYDDAQRLVAVSDNVGSRIEYTLDNAGKRTGEYVKDPGGNLRKALQRSIDALGRVQQVTGRE